MISIRNASDAVIPVPTTDRNASIYFPQLTYADANSSDPIPAVEKSDTISTFKINADRTLSFVQLAPNGGSLPRSMVISPDGSMVAVGLQYANRTVVYERDTTSELLGSVLASMEMDGSGEGDVTSDVWGK